MSRLEDLIAEFHSCNQQGQEVCHFIERGQANTPLLDLYQQLDKGIHAKPLGLTLLGLNSAARSAALKWLYGHNFAVFSLEVSQQIGLLEVHLKEQGYSLEKSTGERLEFETWEAFIAAVNDASLFGGSAESGMKAPKSELKIGTQAPTSVRNLQVLLPEDIQFIAESPALLTRLITESNVLMVAAAPDYQLTDKDKEVLNHLLDDMVAFWPLLPVDELVPDLQIPTQGWWTQLQAVFRLPPILLTTHIDAAIPVHLSEVQDDLRRALQLSLQAKRQLSVSDAVADRFEQELKQLQSRKKRELRKSDTTTTVQHDLTLWTQLRTELNDHCQQALKALQETGRKRELPNSTGNVSLKQHTEALTYDDLDREDAYKTIKLSLGCSYQAGLLQFLQHRNKQNLKQDIQLLQEQLQSLAERLSEQCNKQLDYKPNFNVPALDDRSLWQDISDIIGLELRYQGELPKRGFVDRLGEGRKGVMVLVMSAMMLGYIGIDLRNSGWMGLLLLPVFIGTVIYSFVSFNKDEQHRLDKELVRVRDELLSASRRVLMDINRLKQNKLADYTDNLKKQWQLQLDQLAREHQLRSQTERDQSMTRAKARITAIDTQINEWQKNTTLIQRLKTSSSQLVEKTQRYLSNLNQKK